jgi:Tol biopolymer transport system component
MMRRRLPVYLFLSMLLMLVACGSPVEEQEPEDLVELDIAATASPTIQPTLPPTEEAAAPTRLATATPTEMATGKPRQTPAATSVQATLDPVDFNTPQTEVFGPVSPVWLEDDNTISGRTFPAYLSGLSFRDDSVWLVDQNGVANMVMGQPAAGQLSPDGTGFLFPGSDYGSDIFYYNMSSGEVKQLTNTPDVDEHGYRWWPERNNVIVFNFVPEDEIGPWYGYLGAFDFVTGENIIIDDQHGSGSSFGLSPDGERIAYIEGSQPMIYTWGQGSEPIDFQSLGLEYSSFSAPAWSPDGQLVAFHAGGGAIEEGIGGRESATVIYDPRDNSVDVLHRYFSHGQRGGPENAWSPDGEWLAVVNIGEIGDGIGPMALWVMRPDGSEEHHLGFASPPVWSPDGKYLIYPQWVIGSSEPHPVVVVEAGVWEPTEIEGLEGSFLDKWIYLP